MWGAGRTPTGVWGLFSAFHPRREGSRAEGEAGLPRAALSMFGPLEMGCKAARESRHQVPPALGDLRGGGCRPVQGTASRGTLRSLGTAWGTMRRGPLQPPPQKEGRDVETLVQWEGSLWHVGDTEGMVTC